MSFGTSFNAFAEGLNGSVQAARDRKERSAAMQQNEKMLDIMASQQGMAPEGRGLPEPEAGPQTRMGQFRDRVLGAGQRMGERLGLREPDAPPIGFGRAGRGAAPTQGGQGGTFYDLLNRHEGAGDPDTLFGHSQKDGPFAGTRVSQMTVGEALKFADPKGPYARWVAEKNGGTVATPMGEGQIVGSTLRRAVSAMGMDENTPFNQGTQRAVIGHLARQRLQRGRTMDEKMNQIRQEWVGLRKVPDAQLRQAIMDMEAQGSGRGLPARR